MKTLAITHNAILLCSINKDDSDAVLSKKMNEMEIMLAFNSYRAGFVLTINGYEHDSRELWEMPEIKLLTARLVKIGFISLLEVSTHVYSLKYPYEPIYKCSLGAREVWAMSKGILNSKYIITMNQHALFLKDLQKSNRACDKVTGGIKQFN